MTPSSSAAAVGATAFDLSNDHRPDQLAEATRVLAAGVRGWECAGSRGERLGVCWQPGREVGSVLAGGVRGWE